MTTSTSLPETRELRGRERMIDKARRLLAEERVSECDDGTFRVLGDTTVHRLAIMKRDTACSCKGASFNGTCSHKLAIELHLSQKRQAA